MWIVPSLITCMPRQLGKHGKNQNCRRETCCFFTGYKTGEVKRLGIDAHNCAVLDSACSSTVCGVKWINNYIQSLDSIEKTKIKQKDGHRAFKFGGGTCLKSKGEYS